MGEHVVNVGLRTAAERRVLTELAKLEKPHPLLGEARGEWRCNCGETIRWTRDAIVGLPSRLNANDYERQERNAFLLLVNAEIQKHQLTHAGAR